MLLGLIAGYEEPFGKKLLILCECFLRIYCNPVSNISRKICRKFPIYVQRKFPIYFATDIISWFNILKKDTRPKKVFFPNRALQRALKAIQDCE